MTIKPIIGLAGGIGSGKSSVAQMLASLGGRVIDADTAAKAALDEPRVKSQLVDWYGGSILQPDGRVDRSRLADRVFDDEPERQRLESVIHPLVAQSRERQIAEAQADPSVRFIVLDVPLLYEVGLDERCDRVIFVDADRSTRIARLAANRGWDESELARREKNQKPLDWKRKSAHAIVDNNEGKENCLAQVRELMSRILTELQ